MMNDMMPTIEETATAADLAQIEFQEWERGNEQRERWAALEVAHHGDEVLGVDLPASVALTIAETEPGIQGDRVSGARKPATLETGRVVQVPLFIEPGERIKVDTRSGDYIERA